MAFTAGQKLRTSDLAAIDPRGTFTQYTGTNTAVTANSLVDIPFATVAQGIGTGISVTSNTTFTLTKAGLWIVTAQVGVGSTGFTAPTATVLILYTSTGHTATYGQNTAPIGANQMWSEVTTWVFSSGSAAVVVSVDTLASSGTGNILVTPSPPSVSFKWLPE